MAQCLMQKCISDWNVCKTTLLYLSCNSKQKAAITIIDFDKRNITVQIIGQQK